MILDFCCICGKTDDLNQHHVIPKSSGGSNEEINIITLCYEHHNWVHSRKYKDGINHKQLIKEGLSRARALGWPNGGLGRTRISQEKVNQILELRKSGMGMNRIAKQMSVGNSQVLRICREI